MLLMLVLLAAAPSGDRVLVLDLEAAGVEKSDAQIVSSAVAEAAAAHAAVVTGADLRALSDVAAEQQNCGLDSTACLAELAGAVDVKRVLHGRLSRVDDGFLVQLAAFDTGNAAGGPRVSWSGATLQQVLDRAPGQVGTLFGVAAPVEEPEGLSPVVGGVVLGSGAAVAAGAAIAGLVFNQTLLDPVSTREQKDGALFAGRVAVVGGAVASLALLAGGGVLLAVAE